MKWPLLAIIPTLASCKSRQSSLNSEVMAQVLPSGLHSSLESKIEDEEQEIEKAAKLSAANSIKNRESETSPVKRDVHSKHHGCVKGTLSVKAGLSEPYAFGLFAKPAEYKTWVRHSNAGILPKNNNDVIPDLRGMAIKVIDVPGAKVFSGEENVDFL